MNQRAEFIFLKKLLEQYRLNVHIISESDSDYTHIDKGVRQYLGLNNLFEVAADLMKIRLAPNTIYAITDDFFSSYYVLEVPNDDELCFMIIGPYTEQNFTKTDLLVIAEQHKVPDNIKESLIQYYVTIPFIADASAIRVLLSAFYETIWENEENCIFEEVRHNLVERHVKEPSSALLENISEATDISFKMKLLEERYQIENLLIKYVSQGNSDKAIATLAGINNAFMENRATTRLRDYKNYNIVLNTLLRKSAEAGLVHPIHIDKLSSHFALLHLFTYPFHKRVIFIFFVFDDVEIVLFYLFK